MNRERFEAERAVRIGSANSDFGKHRRMQSGRLSEMEVTKTRHARLGQESRPCHGNDRNYFTEVITCQPQYKCAGGMIENSSSSRLKTVY